MTTTNKNLQEEHETNVGTLLLSDTGQLSAAKDLCLVTNPDPNGLAPSPAPTRENLVKCPQSNR